MIQSRLTLLPCPRPCSSILFLQPMPSLVMDQFWELLARELTMRFGLLGWKALSAWGRVLQALIWQGICDWACKARVLLSINENDSMLRLWKHKRKHWNLLPGHESHLEYLCSLNAVLTCRIISQSFLGQTVLVVWETDGNSTGFPSVACKTKMLKLLVL